MPIFSGRGQVPATTTNDTANTASMGYSVVSTASTVAGASGTSTNMTSISLPAGDWIVHGSLGINLAATTTLSIIAGGISTASTTFPASAYIWKEIYGTAEGPNGYIGCNVPTQHFSLSTTTTVYLVGQAFYNVSTATFEASLVAYRIR